MPTPLNILIVEDSADDTDLLVAELRRAGFDPKWKRVETEPDYRASLGPHLDIVFSDFSLPQFSTPRALELLKTGSLDIPFIIVSGTIGEERAVESMKAGATDYVLKDRINRIGPVVQRALKETKERKELKHAEEELRTTHTQLRQLLEHSPAVIYALRVEGQNVVPHVVSENITELLGFTVPESLHYEWWVGQLHPDDRDRTVASLTETLAGGTSLTEYRVRHKDGGYRWVEDKRRLIRDSTGKPMEIVGVWADITERKRAEEVLHGLSSQESGKQKRTILRDVVVLLGLTALLFVLAHRFNLFEWMFSIIGNEKIYPFAEEIFGALALLPLALIIFSYRRWKESVGDVVSQKHIAEALRVLHEELDRQVQQRTVELTKSNDALRMEIVERKKVETERKKLEEQFRQSQKMEGIGQLAGGVAHDFNNILAVIQIQSDLLKIEGNLSPKQLDFTDGIGAAAQRAAALTRQLLLFSRKETLQPHDLDLNQSINNMTKMLRRILGEDIQMEFKFAMQPLFIHADPGMMDQVLMNLAVNSRDAMPMGGRLVIETSAADFDESVRTQSVHARPGSFVCLSVSDTGCGIPPEILPRIFEPFFTTKDVGKGTGLGLATVFGIVQQHQGWVNVYSEVGHGTTFRIYLPQLAGTPAQKKEQPTLSTMRGGDETILLVEDDPFLRVSERDALSQLGYRVLEAATGAEALEVWKHNRDRIHMVLTDMVMPGGMSGMDLGERLLKENPRLKVIYMSGYSAEITGKDFKLKEGVNFLTKPFQASKFAQTIRDSLDAKT